MKLFDGALIAVTALLWLRAIFPLAQLPLAALDLPGVSEAIWRRLCFAGLASLILLWRCV